MKNKKINKVYIELFKMLLKLYEKDNYNDNMYLCDNVPYKHNNILLLFEPFGNQSGYEGAGWFSESMRTSKLYSRKNRKQGNILRLICILFCIEMTK